MLFCLKIETDADEDESEGSESECADGLDLSKVTEMRLVPSDPSQCIDALFSEVFVFNTLVWILKLW